MATMTKDNQIRQAIRTFPVIVKKSVWLDVVDLQPVITATALTLIVVTLQGFVALLSPVATSVGVQTARTVNVVGVILAFHAFGVVQSLAVVRAKPAVSQLGLCLVDRVLSTANLAFNCDKVFGATCGWFGLTGGVLRPALIRAKFRLPVGPFFKLVMTPLAFKCGPLAGDCVGFVPAGNGAEAVAVFGPIELFAAVFASEHKNLLSVDGCTC